MSGATPKQLSLRFAEYLALPIKSKASASEVTSAVLKALHATGVRIIFVDDIHFLDCSQKEGKLANDHLKELANYCAATFTYAEVDVKQGGLFTEGSSKRKTQTSGRFSVLDVEPFALDLLHSPNRVTNAVAARQEQQREEWMTLVWTMESSLCLFKHDKGSLTRDWECMLQRTGGSIASLSWLIRTSAIMAIDDSSEAITRRLMDSVDIDQLASDEYEVRQRQVSKSSRVRTPRAS